MLINPKREKKNHYNFLWFLIYTMLYHVIPKDDRSYKEIQVFLVISELPVGAETLQ